MRHTALAALAWLLVVGGVTPAPGAAQASEPEIPRTLNVGAHASVQRVPDRAVVQLAVETVAETALAATAENAAAMDRVLTALGELGIPEARIRTTRIDLQPRYDQRREAREPVIVAYQAINQVMVQLDDLDLVGRTVDAAVRAGANRVTGIRFELRDPQTAYHEALRQAVAQAREEATVLAEALGETLGPAIQVSTGGVQPPPVRMEALGIDLRAMDATPPVQPGELDVTATVSITYRLDP
jgi:uncharacterized protein